jgi:hypothetical protein
MMRSLLRTSYIAGVVRTSGACVVEIMRALAGILYISVAMIGPYFQ